MPPPPVTMAASKLRIQTLEEQLKQKDKIFHALEAKNHSLRALAAEEATKAREKELAKMNMGWRKHNVNPHTPGLHRSEGITVNDKGNVRTEKAILATKYRFAMERVRRLDAEAGKAKECVQALRAEQRDAYRKTQELIKIAEGLEVKVPRDTRVRIAESSPEEDQDATTTDGNTTDSDGDVNMGGLSIASSPTNGRLVLHPPKVERGL